MADLVQFNGVTYVIPVPDDINWGQNVTDFLVAIPAGALQKTGGAFTLTADVDFGANFGLLSAYFRSRSANVASAGMVRLANTDLVEWRNFANSGNNTLGVNTGNQLVYNGVALEFNSLTSAHIFVGNASNVATDVALTGDIGITNAGVSSIQAGVIVNAQINASAAIAYTKLSLTGQIVNADIYSAAAIAYSKLNLSASIVNADIATGASIAYAKLNLTGSILNADISASAAIALSKLATVTANRVLLSDASGFVSASTVTNTTLGFLDATSSIQTQLNAKQATGNYITALTGDVTASGPNSAAATLATVNSNVGSFTLANITVNAKGLITAASNGSAGAGTVTSVTGTTNQIAVATGTTTPVISIANPVTFPGAMTAGGALAMGANKITGLANGTATTDAAAYGQVASLQHVQGTETTGGSTASATFVSVGASASITPSSASHRVKITFNTCFSVSILGNQVIFGVSRAGTDIVTVSNSPWRGVPAGTNDLDFVAGTYIDSPSTTSATTYQIRMAAGGGTASMGNGAATGAMTVITLEEII